MSERQFTNRLTLPPWRSIGEVAAELTAAAGRATIARLLQCASQGDADAFEQADRIRQRLSLSWSDLVDERRAA